jgi:hypothetical protein
MAEDLLRSFGFGDEGALAALREYQLQLEMGGWVRSLPGSRFPSCVAMTPATRAVLREFEASSGDERLLFLLGLVFSLVAQQKRITPMKGARVSRRRKAPATLKRARREK